MKDNPRVDIVVQARAGSSRLPNKVLMPILNRPMLDLLLERLSYCQRVTEVVLATTDNPLDDEVAAVADKRRNRVIRGSEKDVLSRFLQVARQCESDIIVRVCADNPLTDPDIVDKSIETLIREGVDHLSLFQKNTFPYGSGCAVFTAKALEFINTTSLSVVDKEHVEPALFREDSIKTSYFKAPPHLNRPDVSLTVDYQHQFDWITNVFEKLYQPDQVFLTQDVLRLIDTEGC